MCGHFTDLHTVEEAYRYYSLIGETPTSWGPSSTQAFSLPTRTKAGNEGPNARRCWGPATISGKVMSLGTALERIMREWTVARTEPFANHSLASFIRGPATKDPPSLAASSCSSAMARLTINRAQPCRSHLPRYFAPAVLP